MRRSVCAVLFAIAGFPSLLYSAVPYGVLPSSRTPLGTIKESLDITYVRTELSWATAEPVEGSSSFDTANDRRIAAIEAAGLRVFPSLTIGRAKWINDHDERFGDRSAAVSYPPLDLSTIEDPRYGYSRRYYDFVYRFVSHYAGHFDWIAIENEPNSALFWGGTADEYVRIVRTAYRAVKTADPKVRVTDGGMVSTALGLSMALDRMRAGVLSHDQAVRLGYDFVTKELPPDTINPMIDTEAEIAAQFDNPASPFNTLIWPNVNTILDGLSGSIDALNFHFYESPLFLSDLAKWLRTRTLRAPRPYSPALLSNEIGVRSSADLGCGDAQLFSRAERERQSSLMLRKLILARAAGLEAVLYFSIDSVCTDAPNPTAVGLFETDFTTLRPLGLVFAEAAAMLGNDAVYEGALAEGPDLYVYSFRDSTQRGRLLGAWSTSATSTLVVDTAGVRTLLVLDPSGRTRSIPATGSTTAITITGPVLIRLDGASSRRRPVRLGRLSS